MKKPDRKLALAMALLIGAAMAMVGPASSAKLPEKIPTALGGQ